MPFWLQALILGWIGLYAEWLTLTSLRDALEVNDSLYVRRTTCKKYGSLSQLLEGFFTDWVPTYKIEPPMRPQFRWSIRRTEGKLFYNITQVERALKEILPFVRNAYIRKLGSSSGD